MHPCGSSHLPATHRIRHSLLAEELQLNKHGQEQQWEVAMQRLKETREHMEQEHEKIMEQINKKAEDTKSEASTKVLYWFNTQVSRLDNPRKGLTDEEEKAKQLKEKEIQELKNQQEEISKRLTALQGEPTHKPDNIIPNNSQEVFMNQIKDILAGKQEEDPNRMLLKALVTTQNKSAAEGGTNTLKPSILNSLLTPESGNNRADWLGSLNKQEEGESELSKLAGTGDGDAKAGKARSGMLDRATTNIQQKQVWPQQNLGEDWADEDVELKQIKFEHMVAGETRTIETCTDPAQILGRLRLLRRVAYLKLRGYDWHLIRKMYAAILISIETKEYSWESNFDRFETILYRKAWVEHKSHSSDRHNDREGSGRKRYCRDFNRPEGCPKPSPHTVWVGTGPAATKRTVYHYCVACLVRDRQQREHPEGHPDCPHWD